MRSASLGLDASWEPDLFGGTRAGVRAAESDARAAQMNLAHVQVSLAAEVALEILEGERHHAASRLSWGAAACRRAIWRTSAVNAEKSPKLKSRSRQVGTVPPMRS